MVASGDLVHGAPTRVCVSAADGGVTQTDVGAPIEKSDATEKKAE